MTNATTSSTKNPSLFAGLATVFALLGIAAAIAGPAAAQFVMLKPFQGFLLCMAGFVLGGLLALLCGIVGLLSTRPSSGRSGRGRAWFGVFVGLVLLGTLGFFATRSGNVPLIHDITTNPDDPPPFTKAALKPDNVGRNMTYPEGAPDAAKQQRDAYPDLQPLVLGAPPAEVFKQAKAAAQSLGWIITSEDPDSGLFEAEDISHLFRFVDDIVVRVRPKDAGSVVDVRSLSRVGKGDTGVNAARIRKFLASLQPPRSP